MRTSKLGFWTLIAALAASTLSLHGGGWESAAAQGERVGRRGPGAGGRFWGEGRGGRRGGAAFRLLRDEDVRDRLGLSPEQRRSLDSLLFDSAQRAIQLRADMKSLRLDMARLGKQDNPDRGAMDAKLEQISALRTDQARLRLDAMFQLRDLLSPEQRDLLRQIAKERRAQRRGPGRP